MANVYFFVLSMLQLVPVITTTDGVPTILYPLSIIMAVSMIKDVLEDWKRHKADNGENQKHVQHFDRALGDFKEVQW